MSQPVPEESNEAIDLTEPPADEHASELPDETDRAQGPVDPSGPGGIDAPPPPGGPTRTDTAGVRAGEPGKQAENAGSSAGQPSDSAE